MSVGQVKERIKDIPRMARNGLTQLIKDIVNLIEAIPQNPTAPDATTHLAATQADLLAAMTEALHGRYRQAEEDEATKRIAGNVSPGVKVLFNDGELLKNLISDFVEPAAKRLPPHVSHQLTEGLGRWEDILAPRREAVGHLQAQIAAVPIAQGFDRAIAGIVKGILSTYQADPAGSAELLGIIRVALSGRLDAHHALNALSAEQASIVDITLRTVVEPAISMAALANPPDVAEPADGNGPNLHWHGEFEKVLTEALGVIDKLGTEKIPAPLKEGHVGQPLLNKNIYMKQLVDSRNELTVKLDALVTAARKASEEWASIHPDACSPEPENPVAAADFRSRIDQRLNRIQHIYEWRNWMDDVVNLGTGTPPHTIPAGTLISALDGELTRLAAELAARAADQK